MSGQSEIITCGACGGLGLWADDVEPYAKPPVIRRCAVCAGTGHLSRPIRVWVPLPPGPQIDPYGEPVVTLRSGRPT